MREYSASERREADKRIRERFEEFQRLHPEEPSQVFVIRDQYDLQLDLTRCQELLKELTYAGAENVQSPEFRAMAYLAPLEEVL